ncbi:MAG: hypothetical protein ABFR36_09790 [Acidobacteriota bacterium]
MSRLKKLILVFLFSFFMIISGFSSDAQKELIKVQLRVMDGDKAAQTLDDLKLFINKKEVQIIGKVKRERYIDKENLLGRNFVLTFMNFDQFDVVLENAISYFVTEVLEKPDSLIVHTNVDIHQIKVTENKERMILDISNRLKRDMNYLSKKASRILKNINGEIFKLERYFSSLSPSSTNNMGGVRYFQFFSNLIPDIQFYKNEFMIPDKKKFIRIHKEFGFREGDRYWIFFQNGNIYPFAARIRGLVKSVRGDVSLGISPDSSWMKILNNKIRELTEIMSMWHQYPEKVMRNWFVKTNTSLFTLYYSQEKNIKPDQGVDFQLSEILRGISENLGGILVETADLEESLGLVRTHKDRFWEISFDIPGPAGIKKIKMESGGKNGGLIYRKKFEPEELKELRKYMSDEGISIGDLRYSDKKLSFSIRSLSLNKKGSFGLLKVVIQLYDDTGKEVYRRSNTLRAGKKKINVSTGIPEEFSSGHDMKVTVLDIISNRLTFDEIKMDK